MPNGLKSQDGTPQFKPKGCRQRAKPLNTTTSTMSYQVEGKPREREREREREGGSGEQQPSNETGLVRTVGFPLPPAPWPIRGPSDNPQQTSAGTLGASKDGIMQVTPAMTYIDQPRLVLIRLSPPGIWADTRSMIEG
ncbi:uncharacterized protein PG986_009800 [Apiospora aurea]|uniref:Uncharacterized protein n=1 Tax=Apiospora aurea TaxID=335848 RepID=A0ABR1Q930_9PEZI